MKKVILIIVCVAFAGCSSSKKSNDTPGDAKETKLPTTKNHDYITSVKMKVRAESDKVANCYTEAIKESEDLVGKIYFAWDIIDDGSIEKLRVNREKSTISSEKLETCMIDIFNQIQFDPLTDKDIVHINYPFKFTGKKK